MEKVKELFVVLDNKPGALGDLCLLLEKHKINIDTIGVFVDSAKIIVKDHLKTKKLLEENNYIIEIRDVLRIEIENKPGELGYLTSRIGHIGINIDYLYSSFREGEEKATIILDVSDIETTLSLFK